MHRISRLLGLCINQFSLFLLHISIKIPPSSRKVKKVSVNGQGQDIEEEELGSDAGIFFRLAMML